MVNFTKQQLNERWDMMPVNLREILCSPDYGKIIWSIGENSHFTDEKIGKIMRFAGYVVMGFIHPEDLAKEIKEVLNINPEIANAIYREIDKKIFAPIRSEIDKVYSPAVALAEEGALPISKEHIIDLKTFQKQAEIKEKEKIFEKPVEIKKELPSIPLPSEAISKTETEPAGPSVVSEAEPVIIHKEIETKPTLGKQRSLGGLFGFLKTQKEETKIQEQKPITAEVEIPIFEPPKVVHYSDLKTPLSVPMPPKPFGAAQGESEIKSKIFESEIIKAKEAGLIINNQQLTTDKLQTTNYGLKTNINEIPIEIEEVPRQSFFSRILQFFAGLFVTKKKVIKEIPAQPITNPEAEQACYGTGNQQPTTTIKMSEAPKPPQPFDLAQDKPETKKEFEFPIEIKLPGPFDAGRSAELSRSPQGKPFNFVQGKPPKNSLLQITNYKLQTDIKELEPPEVHPVLSRAEGEIRENPQPIAPQPVLSRVEGPEKPKTQDEEVIDLRTFERISKIKNQNAK